MKKVGFTMLFGYGAMAIPIAILGLPMYIYLPTYYAENVGIGMSVVGVVLFLARFIDMITDPLIGIWSDRFKNRYGNRKFFILGGFLLLSASFYALIHTPEKMISGWLFIFSLLIYLGWSIVSIPYLAWSAEITDDYHEKTLLSTSRELFTILGALSAILVPYIFNASDSASQSLNLLFIIFCISALLFTPITLKKVQENRTTFHPQLSMKKLRKIWTEIPDLRRLQGAFFLNALANAIPATLFLLFVKLILQEEAQTGPLLLLYFASGMIGLPFWNMLAKNRGKRLAWTISMVVACIAFFFVPFLQGGDLAWFVVITFISGLSLGADMALPSSMQADVAQSIQKSHSMDSGILFGIWTMLTKFSLSIAVGITFVALGMVGFEPNAPTPLSLFSLSMLYGALPVAIKIVALWLLKDYPETRESPESTYLKT